MTPDREPSRYLKFDRPSWAALRASTPLPLTEDELEALRGINERISLDEVEAIYLPLSRLLNFHVGAVQALHTARHAFLDNTSTQSKAPPAKVPFIIGLAGSVAVGKSTTARLLQALLARWPDHPEVALITTDGFLLPNATLEERGLMQRKGFPESYDQGALLACLQAVKSGEPVVTAPVYSHITYDIVPGRVKTITQPDILIVEGLNVLQVGRQDQQTDSIRFVSDYFDFSIFLDAEETDLEAWYMDRFFELRRTAFRDPVDYFHRYSLMSDEEARTFALNVWRTINLENLKANIGPTRHRADLVLHKGSDHRIDRVELRRL